MNFLINQNMWVGITVGVFIAGIGIGYAVYLNTYQPEVMMTQTQLMQQLMMQSPQHRQQMMSQIMEDDSDLRQKMMESVTQDPQQMRQWMVDTQHIEEMSEVMRENHDFMQEMMQVIIEDPSMRLQMIGHMTENQEAMQQMMQMTGSGMTGNMTGGMIMDQGMMMQPEMMKKIMEDPQLREKMIQQMTIHQQQMEELLSSDLSETEFNEKMIEIMTGHQQFMMEMMQNQQMMGNLFDTTSLINDLKQQGANVILGDEIIQPFFSVPGKTILVNNQNVQIFEYSTQTKAQEDASKVSPDGHSIGLSMPLWVEPPHFYKKVTLIVLYVGNDLDTMNLLEGVIGPQFAGS